MELEGKSGEKGDPGPGNNRCNDSKVGESQDVGVPIRRLS